MTLRWVAVILRWVAVIIQILAALDSRLAVDEAMVAVDENDLAVDEAMLAVDERDVGVIPHVAVIGVPSAAGVPPRLAASAPAHEHDLESLVARANLGIARVHDREQGAREFGVKTRVRRTPPDQRLNGRSGALSIR